MTGTEMIISVFVTALVGSLVVLFLTIKSEEAKHAAIVAHEVRRMYREMVEAECRMDRCEREAARTGDAGAKAAYSKASADYRGARDAFNQIRQIADDSGVTYVL